MASLPEVEWIGKEGETEGIERNDRGKKKKNFVFARRFFNNRKRRKREAEEEADQCTRTK